MHQPLVRKYISVSCGGCSLLRKNGGVQNTYRIIPINHVNYIPGRKYPDFHLDCFGF